MPKPYNNKEYIDWILDITTDTADEGGLRVTPPEKMNIRDVSLTIEGTLAGASVIIQFSPDEMETKQDELDPPSMTWFERDDGTFTGADPFQVWENMNASEGWFRIAVENYSVGNTDIKVKTRPRIEKKI